MTATFNSAPATVIKATANGSTTAGAVSIPGLQVGDAVVLVSPTGFATGFENAVSTAGQLQQLSPLDWSSVGFVFYLIRGV